MCSAKFWLVAFDPAIRIINFGGVEGNGFADDCSTLIGGKSLKDMICKMQKVTDKLTSWGQECGLKFNATKTVAVLFKRKGPEPIHFIKIDGSVVKYSDSVKSQQGIVDCLRGVVRIRRFESS